MSIIDRYKKLVNTHKISKSKKKSILRWITRLIIYEFYQYKLDIPEIKQIRELIDDIIKNGIKNRCEYHNE